MLRKFLQVALLVTTTSSFAQTFTTNGQSVEISGVTSKLNSNSVAASAIDINGTWNVTLVYKETELNFPIQVGLFPELSEAKAPLSVATFFPSNAKNKYRGSFFIPFTNPPAFHLFFFLNDSQPMFVPMKWDGKNFASDAPYGAITKASMVKVNNTHPFTFKEATLAVNVKPREINMVPYFGSPQTAVTNSALAYTEADRDVLASYMMFHYVNADQKAIGAGGIFTVPEALAVPDRFSPPIFLTQLNNAADAKILVRWPTSASVASRKPFVMRVDNEDEGFYATLGEKERKKP